MKNLLSTYGIAGDSVAAAAESIDNLDSKKLNGFLNEFKFTSRSEDDASRTAKYAARAILAGADSVDKVVVYVRKLVTGMTVEAPKVVKVVGVPVVDNEVATVVPVTEVVEGEEAEPVVVKGKRGRKKGNSVFVKAVAIMDGMQSAPRADVIKALIASGINESSAKVYAWKYANGERI